MQVKLSLWLAKACGNRPDRVETRTMVLRARGRRASFINHRFAAVRARTRGSFYRECV